MEADEEDAAEESLAMEEATKICHSTDVAFSAREHLGWKTAFRDQQPEQQPKAMKTALRRFFKNFLFFLFVFIFVAFLLFFCLLALVVAYSSCYSGNQVAHLFCNR